MKNLFLLLDDCSITAVPSSSMCSSSIGLVSSSSGGCGIVATNSSMTIGCSTTTTSLSNLQSCVTNSMQVGRTQEPEISTKLSKYFRGDLIAHVTNWNAEHIEKQVILFHLEVMIFFGITIIKLCVK